MINKIKTILKPDLSTILLQSYFDAKVSAGSPSPAADYEEGRLDLNQHLIKNAAATFFVRAGGDSMVGAGIQSGDLLVVDRSLTPKDKNVVIAVINGQLTVKRIRIRQKKICLEPTMDVKTYRSLVSGWCAGATTFSTTLQTSSLAGTGPLRFAIQLPDTDR